MESETNALEDSLYELRQQDLVKYKQEIEEEKDPIIRKYEQNTKLFQKKVEGISTSFQVVKAKLELESMTAKNEMDTLRVKY